MTLVKRTVSGF